MIGICAALKPQEFENFWKYLVYMDKMRKEQGNGTMRLVGWAYNPMQFSTRSSRDNHGRAPSHLVTISNRFNEYNNNGNIG